jgi:hypothetical protein
MFANDNIGDCVADDQDVFRAFADKGFRKRKQKVVNDYAYYRRNVDKDGISVGLTPAHAVMGLDRNFGYCQLPVAAVHKLPYGIEIRLDTKIDGHAFICHVPFIATEDDTEREKAILIAGALARLSVPKTYDHYPPPSGPAQG